MAPSDKESMESARQRWTQTDRRRKQPSLYDEYLNQEKSSHSSVTAAVAASTPPASAHSLPAQPTQSIQSAQSVLSFVTRPGGVLSRDASATTIRTVTPDKASSNKFSGEPVVQHSSSTQAFEEKFVPLLLPSSTGSSIVGGRGSGSGSSLWQQDRYEDTDRPNLHTLGSTSTAERPDSIDAMKRDNLNQIVGSRRPRTRTMDENKTKDKPPASKHRFRHGSIQHTIGSSHSANDSISSIGHPQVISPLSQTSFGSSSPTSDHRPLSPSSSHSTAESTSSPLPTANAKRILHLMKTLCGRMSGNLEFRRGAGCSWTSSYCYIQDDVGSLMCEPEQDSGRHLTLISDLRGCQVKTAKEEVKTAKEEEKQVAYLEIAIPSSSLELHIRLRYQSDFDSWYAALLCWQPIRPKGTHNSMAKPQSPKTSGVSLADSRRNSEMSLVHKESAIIKVGPMIYWDVNISYTNATISTRTLGRPQVPRMQSYGLHWWRNVSCTLRENGELKLYAESGSNLVSVVQLSQLSRCAIQRLDSSVLDNDYCIVIYPQYTFKAAVVAPIRPIYLALESRMLFEVWFVLLRSLTIPNIYGPTTNIQDDQASPDAEPLRIRTGTGLFRIERSLTVRIIEARLPSSRPDSSHQYTSRSGQWPSAPQSQDGHYVEILLDDEIRGKTQIKHEGNSPFWREEFEYPDLPTVLTSASVQLRRRPPDTMTVREQHERRLVHEAYGTVDTQSGGILDETMGKIEIYLDELEGAKEIEKWWPVMNSSGEQLGEILIKARAEENVILMSRDYEPLSQLLHNFGNELTLQIAQMIPTELKRLSDMLLNILQVTGKVEDWICSLVEEEIDGVHKETPVSRLRYSRRVGSDSENAAAFTASSERELIVRDMNKNATLEANLLFRGNTLLTKSLDSYMRRVGKDYLLTVLGPLIKDINDKDPDCEVDPNKVANERVLERNWQRLLQTTQDIWQAIKTSAKQAPVELKVIFRHIRACAEDRYGDFLRSVSYSSVSGFLFLRFFCPAVLNPKLFGLMKDDPRPRARRTFTLIAKSLQGLANMASFGSKEHWMEPMNTFLSTHRESFKSFIDDVCYLPAPVASAPSGSVQPTAYSTPIAIRNRLPSISREGFPSLPYLIDQAREFAGLVELWLNGTSGKDGTGGIAAAIGKEDGDLLSFHKICTQLRAQTQECLSRAQCAERPNSGLSFRWEEIVKRVENSTGLGPASRPQSKDEHYTEEEADDMTAIGAENGQSGIETPTRDSFDDVAMRAAGEVAARARGARPHNDDTVDDTREEQLRSPQEFENDRDGGAGSVAASLLQQEHSTQSLDRRAGIRFRSSFDMSRAGNVTSGPSSITSGGSGVLQTSQSVAGFLPRDATTNSIRDRAERDREIARDIENSLSGGRRTGAPNSSTFSVARGTSAHGSQSGSAISSENDSNATTALPSWTKERERREKEKEKLKKREKEERERRLKDFVPLAGVMGGFRGRRKDKKEGKEKEEKEDKEGKKKDKDKNGDRHAAVD